MLHSQGGASVFQLTLHKNLNAYPRILGVPNHASIHVHPDHEILYVASPLIPSTTMLIGALSALSTELCAVPVAGFEGQKGGKVWPGAGGARRVTLRTRRKLPYRSVLPDLVTMYLPWLMGWTDISRVHIRFRRLLDS